MKFGPLATEKAEGSLLAHALQLTTQRLKKGQCLSHQDIAAILNDGVESLIVAQLEEGDVDENSAAFRLGQALQSNSVKAAGAATGRVNLYAQAAGIFEVDTKIINGINRMNPAITVATLSNGCFVEKGRMVATVKIIPLAVHGTDVEGAVGWLKHGPAFLVHSSTPMRVALVQTNLPILKPSILAKTKSNLQKRLALAGIENLSHDLVVDHDELALCKAFEQVKADCDLIIVFGASAIIDEGDVIPASLARAKGKVDYLGMPVDPGNLLLIGHLWQEARQLTVIGAPGCARSLAENGFDWILQRVLAQCPVDADYISGLGVGGLLMEVHDRPQPREG